jgi:uncharacterized protein
MAVPCPRCGREYDVTLFPFGRTISCTCGARVGIAPRMRPPGDPGEKRFFADVMLGSLARWLRFLGFDCAYDRQIEDGDLVRRGIEEERVVLTRDRKLPEEWWAPGIYRVQATRLQGQLREVFHHFHLADSLRPLTRCAECNHPIRPVPTAAVADRVPRRVLEFRDTFYQCGGCGRVYWEGTHTARIRKTIEALLEEA